MFPINNRHLTRDCNSRTQEAEAGRPPGVQGQPGHQANLGHTEIISLKKKQSKITTFIIIKSFVSKGSNNNNKKKNPIPLTAHLENFIVLGEGGVLLKEGPWRIKALT